MIETHAHYDDSRFDEDREELLSSFPARGIELVVNVGADMESSAQSIALTERYAFVYAAVGVHPHEARTMRDDDLDILRTYAGHAKVVAIGEIGLDYYYDNSPRDIQRRRFAEQLELASSVNLPVIIHSRDACAETFDIISQSAVRRGVIHCYSGSRELALEYIKLGFYIGVGGVVTYKKARRLVETVEAVPIERILLETDCPYLAPEPYRGKRNSSLYLWNIAERIAGIKNLTCENVEAITHVNALTLFSKMNYPAVEPCAPLPPRK